MATAPSEQAIKFPKNLRTPSSVSMRPVIVPFTDRGFSTRIVLELTVSGRQSVLANEPAEPLVPGSCGGDTGTSPRDCASKEPESNGEGIARC